MKQRAQREQDYWLSFLDDGDWAFWGGRRAPTTEEREVFLRYDSRGRGSTPVNNPIYFGKVRHGQTGEILRAGYLAMDGGWPGGLSIVQEPPNVAFADLWLRSLREWFSDAAVADWVMAAKAARKAE